MIQSKKPNKIKYRRFYIEFCSHNKQMWNDRTSYVGWVNQISHACISLDRHVRGINLFVNWDV